MYVACLVKTWTTPADHCHVTCSAELLATSRLRLPDSTADGGSLSLPNSNDNAKAEKILMFPETRPTRVFTLIFVTLG